MPVFSFSSDLCYYFHWCNIYYCFSQVSLWSVEDVRASAVLWIAPGMHTNLAAAEWPFSEGLSLCTGVKYIRMLLAYLTVRLVISGQFTGEILPETDQKRQWLCSFPATYPTARPHEHVNTHPNWHSTNQLLVRSHWPTPPQEHRAGTKKPSWKGLRWLSPCNTSAGRHSLLDRHSEGGWTFLMPPRPRAGVKHSLVTLWYRNHKLWKVWSQLCV